MPLIATPGARNANAYVSRNEALGLLHETPWYADITSDVLTALEPYLIWATRLLDAQIEWYGTPTTATQALGLPRDNLMTEPEAFATTVIAGAGAANNLLFSGATITGPAGAFSTLQVHQWVQVAGAGAANGIYRITAKTSGATDVLTVAHVNFTSTDSSIGTVTGLTNAQTIPDAVRHATAEYAMSLYKNDPQTFEQYRHLSSLYVGDTRLDFRAGRQSIHEAMPGYLRQILRPFGDIVGRGTVRLVRT